MENLTVDEVIVLDAYRKVKQQGTGTIFIELQEHRCSKFEVKEGAFHHQLNAVLPGGRAENLRER